MVTTCCRPPRVARAGGRPGDRRRDSARTQPPSPRLPRENLLTPQRLGPYELDELLGGGPFGEVYRAWDTRRSRTVALEVLSPELSADAGFRARFEQVSRAVAALDEPHLVAVHEVGELDGRLYRDVQLVDGRALSAVLATAGPLPAGVAVDVVEQVAAALDAAHAAGVVHGDVRPAAVLLSGPGDRPECHLTGFGRAGDAGGHRSDVIALAHLLSEALTGRPGGPDTDDPERAGALGAVVARGTARDPAAGYGSAGELAAAARAALRRASDTVPVRTTPAPSAAGASGRAGGPGAAAVHGARHRHRPPGPWSGRRRGLAAALVAGAVALTAAGGVAALRLASDDADAAASTPVVLEPADAPGADPFVPAPPGTAGAGGEDGEPAPGSAGGPREGDDAGSTGTPEGGGGGPEGSAGPTEGTGGPADGSDGPAEGSEGPAEGSDSPVEGSAGSAEGSDSPAEGSEGPAEESDSPAEGSAGPAEESDGAASGTGDPGSGAVPSAIPSAITGSPVAGDRPGLYGGSGAEVCDPAGMATYLAENPDRAAAFAAVEEIPADRIDEHLATLTPVVLRFDTAVTNHGFADGRAVPYQSVLQAGTAVLVDDTGVPQVRCICGNPLEPPAARPAPEYRGDPWRGATPEDAVVVERSATRVAEFVLVDDATGAVGARPVRTAGEADRAVDAALAEQARGAGGDRPVSPADGGTTSADPSPPPSSGGDPSGPDEQPSSTGDGSGRSVPPGEDPGTPSPSGADPRDTGSPDAPAPEDGADGSAPADGTPPEETQAPPEEEPAEEPSTEEPSTEEPSTEDAPAEEPPAESPTEPPTESPTGDAPTSEPPTESPTGDAPAADPPAQSPARLPGESPTGDAPAAEPPTQSPTQPPSGDAPAAEPPTQSPTQPPSGDAPAAEPPTQSPTEPPGGDASAAEPPTQSPTEPPGGDASAAEPPTESPGESPTGGPAGP